MKDFYFKHKNKILWCIAILMFIVITELIFFPLYEEMVIQNVPVNSYGTEHTVIEIVVAAKLISMIMSAILTGVIFLICHLVVNIMTWRMILGFILFWIVFYGWMLINYMLVK